MKTVNVICDVQGEYQALMKLLEKMPRADHTVLVGDLNDRGPDSKSVIEWAIKHQDTVTTLHSNHGHLFTDTWRWAVQDKRSKYYSFIDFFSNGGVQTLDSYGPQDGSSVEERFGKVPLSHIEFLETRPIIFESSNGLIASHAPILGDFWQLRDLYEKDPDARTRFVWNRENPVAQPGKFQVFGHNSHWGYKPFYFEREPGAEAPSTAGDYALCIDTTRIGNFNMKMHGQCLTGLHWNPEYPGAKLGGSYSVFQEPFLK